MHIPKDQQLHKIYKKTKKINETSDKTYNQSSEYLNTLNTVKQTPANNKNSVDKTQKKKHTPYPTMNRELIKK